MVKKAKKEDERPFGAIFFPEDAKEVLRKVYQHYQGLRNRDEMLHLLTKKNEEIRVEEDKEVKENGVSPEPHELPVAVIITRDGKMFSVQKKEAEDKDGKRVAKHGELVYFKPIRKNTWACEIESMFEKITRHRI